VVVTQEEAIENLRLVIRINESYDTALLNDLALYLSINKAMTDLGKLNVVVRSGEPADMLFRGYTVTYKMRQSELNLDIDKLSSTNLPLASLERKTQIKMDYPYLDTNIKEFAKNLSKDENVVYRTRPGDVWSTHEENTDRLTMPPYPFGKLVLRQAMFDILPIEIVLRNKTDIQFGSGTDNLKAQLRETISPLERAAYEAEGFSFRDIVHAAMYKLFKKEGLHPRKLLTETETSCSSCHGAVEVGRNYCITCGSEHPNVSFDEIRKSK
jgi:asparagine synthetase B (glutamine-hydrolysing)